LVSNDLKKVQWDFGKGLSNDVNFRFKKRKIVHLNLEGWELKEFPDILKVLISLKLLYLSFNMVKGYPNRWAT